jgi:hypothetical protein
MSFITGKYIFIAHGKQITSEKYDIPFNFESLSFFVPAGYVLENPPNILGSSILNIAKILCENRLNLDRISKVPLNGVLRLRKMIFTASDNDRLQGNEIFYENAGLYYCGLNTGATPIKILNWHNLKSFNKISFKILFNIINNHAESNNINPSTTALFLYTCRSSCVEPKKGYVTPRILPLKGVEKKIGIGGPSISQLKNNLIITPYIDEKRELQSQAISGGNYGIEEVGLFDIVNVDENMFYKYNFDGLIKGGREKNKTHKKYNKKINKIHKSKRKRYFKKYTKKISKYYKK